MSCMLMLGHEAPTMIEAVDSRYDDARRIWNGRIDQAVRQHTAGEKVPELLLHERRPPSAW
jgi:hypothetical protein